MIPQHRLIAEIDLCNLHARRLEKALYHLKDFVPFNEDSFQHLSDADLGFCEMLTARFSKLQDAIGKKVFPLVLFLLQETQVGETALDRLHKLEKLNLIPSTAFWSELREMRNSIAHDYPEPPAALAASLNLCIQKAREMLNFWQTFQEKIKEKLP